MVSAVKGCKHVLHISLQTILVQARLVLIKYKVSLILFNKCTEDCLYVFKVSEESNDRSISNNQRPMGHNGSPE